MMEKWIAILTIIGMTAGLLLAGIGVWHNRKRRR